MLIRENAAGVVAAVYADPAQIGKRYGLNANFVEGLAALTRLVDTALTHDAD